MPVKHSSFASHLIHQPLAQQLFISVTRGWLFQTQSVILDTPSSLTFAMTMMCCLRPVIWSRRQIIFLSLSLVLDQVSSLAYSTPSVYLFMVQLCGPSIRALEISFNKLLCRIWRLPARSHTTIMHHIARLPSLFNVIHSHSLSLLHSADLVPLVWLNLSFVSHLSAPLRSVVLTHFMVNATLSSVIRNMPCVQTSSALFD